MIPAIIENLDRGVRLLDSLTDTQYSDNSTPPYYSSIGVHMRHILDVFDCIFRGLEVGQIDLSDRRRNSLSETKVEAGLTYFSKVIQQLEELSEVDLNRLVRVNDDLGQGMVSANYTLASVLIQAHSHAIHHFASIGYIIARLDIALPDADFGYNPTTPRGQTAH